MIRFEVYLFLAAFFFIASSAYAQLIIPEGPSANAGGIEITTSPRYPEPGDLVRLSAASFSFDIDRSDVTWLANGEVIARGAGLKEAAVVAGPLGSETSVRVIAQGGADSAGGEAKIRPTELDLLWESDSYVPPYYRGRALPSAGTSLRLQVIPRFKQDSGEILSARDLVFTWRRNGSVLPSASGRGRASAVLPAPVLFGADAITVHAESLDGGLAGEAEALVPSVEPVLALYEDHPLLGVTYHRALSGQTSVPDSEMTFAAVPYFAQADGPDDYQLRYAWRVNGRDVEADLNRPSKLTINAEGSSGLALVELTLTQANNLIMRAVGRWGIELMGEAASVDPFNTQQ